MSGTVLQAEDINRAIELLRINRKPEPYRLFFTEKQIFESWGLIKKDPDFPFKDMESPQEFIDKIKDNAEDTVILGAVCTLVRYL